MTAAEKPADLLLVEDNQEEAKLLLTALKKNNPGKHILWINDGEKALKYLLSDKVKETQSADKKVMLVLLDLTLPKVSGFEILEKIKHSKKAGGIDFIVITGSQNESDRARSYGYGVKLYMRKDIVCENCLRMLRGDKTDNSLLKIVNETYED